MRDHGAGCSALRHRTHRRRYPRQPPHSCRSCRRCRTPEQTPPLSGPSVEATSTALAMLAERSPSTNLRAITPVPRISQRNVVTTRPRSCSLPSRAQLRLTSPRILNHSRVAAGYRERRPCRTVESRELLGPFPPSPARTRSVWMLARHRVSRQVWIYPAQKKPAAAKVVQKNSQLRRQLCRMRTGRGGSYDYPRATRRKPYECKKHGAPIMQLSLLDYALMPEFRLKFFPKFRSKSRRPIAPRRK